jgi:hypothetical protein
VAVLSTDRAEWGQAMIGELGQVVSRSQRRRFAFRCSLTVLFLRPRRGAPGRLIATTVQASAVGCVGLVAFALIRFPGLISGVGTLLALSAFLAVIVGYSVAASVIADRLSDPSSGAVRIALVGAAALALVWVLIGLSASVGSSQDVGTALFLLVPTVSVLVGAVGSRRLGARIGFRVSLLSALSAALLVFLIWFGEAALTSGRPYDAGLVRDFRSSGAGNLATYAVNDNLGTALMLLLLVPLLATLSGLIGASIARLLRIDSR